MSVCPFVKRVDYDKKEEKSVQIFIPHERTFSLVFREEEWLEEGDVFYLKFWPKLTHPVARSVSAIAKLLFVSNYI